MWYCWQHGWLSVAFAFGAGMIYIYATFQPRYTSKSFWKEFFFQNCLFKFSTPPNTLSTKWAFQNSTLQALHYPRRLHLVQLIFLLSVAIWKKQEEKSKLVLQGTKSNCICICIWYISWVLAKLILVITATTSGGVLFQAGACFSKEFWPDLATFG